MSLIKIYRYRVQPERVPQFLEIQKQADALYRDHVDYKVAFYRSQTDLWHWTEIHTYPSMEMLLKATELGDRSAKLRDLFAQFLETLDPKDKNISEEVLDHFPIVTQDSSKLQAAPICYVEIPAPEMDRAVTFYRSSFSWEIKQSNLDNSSYWEFSAGDGQISGGLVQERSAVSGGVIFYLKVADIEIALRQVSENGGKVVRGKTEIGGGYGYSAFIDDPNGNRIGLFCQN